MSGMKQAASATFLLILAVAASASLAIAQDGSIEFVARATPSGGLEEPVRGFPFFLLNKSFEDITKEADAAFPKPSMDAFIDKLDVSKELKEWMKKNDCTALSGEDFIHKLHAADIMGVPEFYSTYMQRNAGDQSLNFPKPKFKPSDKTKDPAKYKKLSAEYDDAVRHYITQNPDSIDGIDLGLAPIDPGSKWQTVLAKRIPEIRRLALSLAQSKYLVGRTETNLEGKGYLRGIAPGTYWLSTLDVPANVGDARPRWNVPVTITTGKVAHVVLSNFNMVQPSPTSP
jgi:hypothetical protein